MKLLVWLINRADDDGIVRHSEEEIAEFSGLTKTFVENGLTLLARKKLVKHTRGSITTEIRDWSEYGGQDAPEDHEDAVYEEIVGYLNEQAGTRYRSSTGQTRSLIRARLRDGATPDLFRAVIDHKVDEWGDDPKMSRYLRPTTLFQASKFESYVNEALLKRKAQRSQKKPERRLSF